MRIHHLIVTFAIALGIVMATQRPAAEPQAQQPDRVEIAPITGDGGLPPRYAVPEFVAVTPDVADIAKVIGPVLYDDFAFERDVTLVARDVAATVPVARAADQVPFNNWREVGADAVVFGSVQRSGTGVSVQVRLFNVRTRQQVFGQEYTGPTSASPRSFAHRIADDIHKAQRNLRGVARTKIAFVSDRTRQRLAGSALPRDAKEIWMADYDGANQRQVTQTRDLNGNPVWAPDAQAIAYASWRRVASGGPVEIFESFLYKGIQENPTRSVGHSSYLPAYSPDGTRIAFVTSRDGNSEIYVVNRDGSNLRRLTNNAADDTAPAWSPNGQQIAFVSTRLSVTSPRLYIMNADGSGQRAVPVPDTYVDRPSWAPAPYSEIVYYARSGPGYDIRVWDIATQSVRSLTHGEGSNESPSYSASGRHIVFTSTRTGRAQLFTIGRDGSGLRQITREGTNTVPSWSN